MVEPSLRRPPTLATGINILPQVHFTPGTLHKTNVESLFGHKYAQNATALSPGRAKV